MDPPHHLRPGALIVRAFALAIDAIAHSRSTLWCGASSGSGAFESHVCSLVELASSTFRYSLQRSLTESAMLALDLISVPGRVRFSVSRYWFSTSFSTYPSAESWSEKVKRDGLLKTRTYASLVFINSFLHHLLATFWVHNLYALAHSYRLLIETGRAPAQLGTSWFPRVMHMQQVQLSKCNDVVIWSLKYVCYK